MTPTDHRLLRHLGWVIALKLLVLVGLWHAFVADQRVPVDVSAAASHLGLAAMAASAPSPEGVGP